MQPLSQSLKQAIQGWEELELWSPATPERIQAVLREIGQKASADVVELYTITGGFDGMDDHGLGLWSLDKILQENTATHRTAWAFADGLIESHRYRLQYKNELESWVWIDHGADAYPIAESLAEFFHQYNNDPGMVALI